MFSYRHAFHAGNHADVLKHVVLIQVLKYACRKETPLFYIDTHAGGGIYSLEGREAGKNAEYMTGITRLWNSRRAPQPVADYLDVVRSVNPSGRLSFYPGSPFIAETVLRVFDKIRIFEMHPTEIRILEKNIQELAEKNARADASWPVRGKRIIAERKDGFAALKAVLPPPTRRAVTLIDPPYEDKLDYQKAADGIREALKRFPTGTYIVWYPVLQRPESRRFPDRLKQVCGKEWLNITLSVASPVPDGTSGFVSSGVFVINPPWTLAETMKETMPFLVRVLGRDAGAGFSIQQGGAG